MKAGSGSGKKQSNLAEFFGVGAPRVRSLTPLRGRPGKGEAASAPEDAAPATPQSVPAKTAAKARRGGPSPRAASPSPPAPPPSSRRRKAQQEGSGGSAGGRRRKKADSDDDDEEFGADDLVLYDDGDDEQEEEQELKMDDDDDVQEAPPSKASALRLQGTAVPRALELQEAALAAYAPTLDRDALTPMLTTEPEFAFDEQAHRSFVKKLKLCDVAEATASQPVSSAAGDDVSLDSPFASMRKRAGVKYTPLELQFLAVKEKHPDVILFVECGYKYKFFGADAVLASQVLGIMCLTDKNFYVASVPTTRLDIHMERFIVAGHKAGVVRQTETAALKQGNNSKGLFARELTDVYSAATYVGDAVVTPTAAADYMACFTESSAGELVMVAVSLRTSDFVYDVFEDNAARNHLETRLEHLVPVELVLPSAAASANLSTPSSNLLLDWARRRGARVTRTAELKTATAARQWIRTTFASNSPLLQCIAKLPESVAVNVAMLGAYLSEFDLLGAVNLVESMRQFSAGRGSDGRPLTAQLGAECLRNLEVFQLQHSAATAVGTLFHFLDRCVSAPGSRLLKGWLSNPLLRAEDVQARLDAVERIRDLYLRQGVGSVVVRRERGPPRQQQQQQQQQPQTQGNSHPFHALIELLSRSGDLEQDISTIYHRRCKPAKFIATLQAMQALLQAARELGREPDAQLAPLVRGVLDTIARCALEAYIGSCLDVVDVDAASKCDWANIFTASVAHDKVDEGVAVGDDTVHCIADAKAGVLRSEAQLQRHLAEIRQILGIPDLNYFTCSGRRYLVEIARANKKAVDRIPADWVEDQHTKKMLRYITPTAQALLLELCMYSEATDLISKRRWNAFLEEFTSRYSSFRAAVQGLATLDALSSLALVSTGAGYCKPVLCAGQRVLRIVQGRHPVAESLCNTFIGNDCALSERGTEVMIVTGPNMGGKSTYIRGVALIAVMAQVGCFVPCAECTTGLFDAFYTRMGAEDDLAAGRSTFFSELLGTSYILQNATDRSLVIIDELGRGTSTYDGTAIAYATLKHIAETIHCLSFFVTHYPVLGNLALSHSNIGNAHLSYLQGESNDDPITFLYQVKPGLETRSYGLNVARLVFAGMFDHLLARAKVESHRMERLEARRRESEFVQVVSAIQAHATGAVKRLLDADADDNE